MSDFERYAIERLLNKAREVGVEAPATLMHLCGSPVSAGARAYAAAHPELIDEDGFAVAEAICCSGVGFSGRLEDCDCWEPVYEPAVQAEPRPPTSAADLQAQREMCSDCAFRKDSPERSDEWEEDALLSLTEPVTARIPLRNRHSVVVAEAVVDREDHERVAQRRWYRDSTGYPIRYERHGRGSRTKHYLHREVMGLVPGDGREVDHRNRNPLDCRRSNLRIGTHALNHQNRGPNRGRKLGRGVYYDKARGKWQAKVTVDGKQHYLGRYDTPEEADAVVKAARAALMPWSIEAEGPAGGPPYFWCHAGMRRPVKWVHPTKGEMPGDTADWQPPQLGGIPYRADGSPGLLCAGWLARRVRAVARDEAASGVR